MKEVLEKNNTSAHISPSNKGKGLLFSANLPPFDPQEEGPTEEDKYLANSGIKTPATQISAFIENQIGAISTPAALGIGLGGLAVGGAGGAFIYEKVFAAEHAVSINSFPNSFNPPSDKTLVDINPKEVFDPNAKEIFIGINNSVQTTEEKYDAPPVVDPKNPYMMTTTLPIKLNVVDGKPLGLKVERKSGHRVGQFTFPGSRTISRIEKDATGTEKIVSKETKAVYDTIEVKSGLTKGTELAFFYDKSELQDVTIERLGEKESRSETIQEEVFYIKGHSARGEPRDWKLEAASLKLLKDIPPATSETVKFENGSDGSRLVTHPVPLEPGESFAEIVKPSKSQFFDAQLRLNTSSTVTEQDGTVQIGQAETVLANVHNKVNIVTKNK